MKCDICKIQKENIKKYDFHFTPNGKFICDKCYLKQFKKIRSE